jgi:hypothetical protein
MYLIQAGMQQLQEASYVAATATYMQLATKELCLHDLLQEQEVKASKQHHQRMYVTLNPTQYY